MKNLFKQIGFIVLMAMIVFSFTTCDLESLLGGNKGYDDDDDDDDVAVTRVTLNKSTLSLAVGASETLIATVSPSDAANKAVTWATSDATKATVVNGKVTGVAEGTATITVKTTDGNKTDACFVTVGTASTSGWIKVEGALGTSNIDAIAYGNGKFVAGGYQGKMAYSSDAITWTPITTTAFTYRPGYEEGINAIIYANNKFVAVGDNALMAYSSDGINWTAVADLPFSKTHTGTFDDDIRGIAYGNNTFVIVGNNRATATSTDGETWVYAKHTVFDSMILAITFGNGKFVAADLYNKISTSTDGINWTTPVASNFGSNGYIYSFAYGNNKFVAVGTANKIIYSSDGATWTPVDTFVSEYYGERLDEVAFVNNKFIAVGYGGNMLYSSDGVTWAAEKEGTFGPYGLYAVAYGGGKYVVGGTLGNIWYSTGN